MFSRALFAAGVVLGPVASAELTCLEDLEGGIRTETQRGGRSSSDHLLGAWAEQAYNGHVLCEGSNVTGGMIRTKTQLSRGGIGYGTGWQSANPHGECRWHLTTVNGQSGLRGDDEEKNWNFKIDPKFEKYKVCGSGEGGDPWQFGKAMAIQHKHSGTGTTITGYAFLNDDAKKEALEGETLFSIPGVMSACQIEIVVAIPVNPSGDTSFEVEIYFHKDGDEAEKELNAGLRLNRSDSGSLDISSLTEDAADGSNVVMTMATGLVCESTKTKIDDSAITIDFSDDFPTNNKITYTVTEASVAGCNMVYWDPTMTAFGAGSENWPTGIDGSHSVSAAAAVFVSLAYALMQV